MNVWEMSEDSGVCVQAAWRSSDPTALSLGSGEILYILYVPCQISGGEKTASWDQRPKCIHTLLPRRLKTRSALLAVFISELARLCIWETNSRTRNLPELPSQPPPPPNFSNGGPLYWTVKSQPLSARAYMYGSGSVHVLLHTRGHVQTAVLDFARISQTFQPALIGTDWRAHIAVQMQQGKKAQGFRVINISLREKWVLKVSQDESVLASIDREAKRGVCVCVCVCVY